LQHAFVAIQHLAKEFALPVSEVVPFSAADGFQCNLIHVRGDQPPSKGPVLLVHGAGVRANIFQPLTDTTLVDYLLVNGYDVWLENWRASIDFAPNRWTLDQAAAYDHPAAVQKVVEKTGSAEIKAVIHCQGSTSFMMSAVAGLVPQVTTIVSNAVALHPVVPGISRLKLSLATPLVATMTDYLNPQWGLKADGFVPKLLAGAVALTHHECDNAVCKFSSFTYGTGFPVLWRHENLNDATHEWLKHEFASVPLRFFSQIGRSVNKGQLVSVEGLAQLPAAFAAQPPKTTARFAFLAGEQNICFLPESQQRTFDFFEQQRRDFHSLHILPDYGHLDVFIGKNAAQDVFPIILDELDRPR
jgi:pimeloyl-ACP methyl ester carboxylesterase